MSTTAFVNVCITGTGSDSLTLSGPSTVQRQNPCVGCGPGGRTTIQTEMVAMTVTGSSALFGPVQLYESSSVASVGQVIQQTPGADFPATSTFSIFLEMQTAQGVLHTQDPIPMQSVIECIPPIGSLFNSPPNANIRLYNSQGQAVGYIQSIQHQIQGMPTVTPTNTPTRTPTQTPTRTPTRTTTP
jgi:hypothetical protein